MYMDWSKGRINNQIIKYCKCKSPIGSKAK